MTQMTERVTLVMLRAELNVNQVELAQEASVSKSTISLMEKNTPVTEFTARKVWLAINRLRKQADLPPISFDDISWNLV